MAVIARMASARSARFILEGILPRRRNFPGPPGSKFVTMISVKQAGAVGWSEVSSGEAALIQRCAAGDEIAFAELVAGHQRMVVQLAMNLLGERDEALDLSQEVFLRVFRTIARFRGQSTLR